MLQAATYQRDGGWRRGHVRTSVVHTLVEKVTSTAECL